jgi:hypothetical protein
MLHVQDLAPWLLVWLLAAAINVVPAFMPPAWALLAYFHIGQGLSVLREKPVLGWSALLLYTLGPLPSNQLFIPVGLAGAPLAPVLAFFAGTRFIS